MGETMDLSTMLISAWIEKSEVVTRTASVLALQGDPSSAGSSAELRRARRRLVLQTTGSATSSDLGRSMIRHSPLDICRKLEELFDIVFAK